jgi:predicted flavoprotein YhiN
VRGEAIITRTGIEGGAIYALSADLRNAVVKSGQATLCIALRPDLENKYLVARLSAPRGKPSLSNWLRKAAHLSAVGIELDDDFMIRRLPGVFAAGEMLDWEAPTGGYLLQASFATGAAAGRGVLHWLEERMANSE